MGVHRTGARPFVAGTNAATQGFVVLVLIVTKGEVVVGALTTGHQPQRPHQAVGQVLCGFNIARYHRRRIHRCNDRLRRHFNGQRFKEAGIQRHGFIHQRAEAVQHRGMHH